jgi:ATP/maltotriose-dependent transcriptional regulator MalT/DNA-binding SARP family transcriptional activator
MLWLRLDPADVSIDTFVHLLRSAARACRGETPPVAPQLAPSVALGIALQRWLEALFASLPRDFAIVLDEYQTIPAEAKLHALLPLLVESLPDGATVFVTSRDAPPATLARVSTTPGFECIDAEAMRLPHDDAAALAASAGVLEGEAQIRLAKASGGWAAGIVLLARAMLGGVPLPQEGGLPREMLDYFSAEVFDRLPSDMRGFLLRTSVMPWVTPDIAAALTGHPEAERVLDGLRRANFFIERKCGEPAVYEYHPLFRRFLAGRAREVLDPSEQRAIRRRAAIALADAGEPEHAVRLFADLRAWDEIAALVRDHAPRLAGLGRVSTLRAWIDLLPEAAASQRPWVLLWQAWCLHAAREAGAAAGFERAYARFTAVGDREGQFAACGGRLLLADSRAEADRWIGEIERFSAGAHGPEDPALEARVLTGFDAAQLFPPRHALIERWRERATSLARSADTPGMRLRMASFALARDLEYGETDAMSALIVECRDSAEANELAPGERLSFALLEAHHLLHGGADAMAAAMLERLEALANATGFPRDQFAVAVFEFRLALARGDLSAARQHRTAIARAASASPPDVLTRLLGDAELAMLEGDPDAAIAAARAAMHCATLCPVREPLRVACLAAGLLARGDAAEAVLREIAPALDAARRDRMPGAEFSLQLLAALAHSRAGDTDSAVATLAQALRLGTRLGALPRMPNLPRPMLAELAALALAHGVGARYAERLVVRLGLPPPPNAPSRWPWPIRVWTLGAFSVESRLARHGGAGRHARKPYELLKYIAAAGAREVAAGRAIASLWPDLEGDAGKKTFDITLHRLRKSLASDAAVRLEGGRLSLDPQLVWVDAGAFERLAADAEGLVAIGDPSADCLLDEALSLYRGHFLAADDELPWVVPHRARLRDRFIRLVDVAGARWESSGEWQRAERHYRDAIALEPAAEMIHQRLIRALAESGRPAEALDAYRRCRELLSIVLGARPSARTEALCERIRTAVAVQEPVCGK